MDVTAKPFALTVPLVEGTGAYQEAVTERWIARERVSTERWLSPWLLAKPCAVE